MVEHGIDVRGEHTLVFIVHCHSGVCPPEEGLRHIGAVVQHSLYLKECASWTKCESRHSLLVEHTLLLVHPHGDRAVPVLLYRAVNGQECGWTMVLRPVELNASAYPGTCESHECRLHHMVVINEVALLNLVVSHLHAAAEFGQYHYLYIFVFDIHGMVFHIFFLVGYRLNHGIWINHPRRTLIDSFLEEYRGFLRLTYFICRYAHCFFPSFNHCIYCILKS